MLSYFHTKNVLPKINWRFSLKLAFAIFISLFANHYFSPTHQGWIVLCTVLVMLTATGSALYQGLLRYLFFLGIVVFVTELFSSPDLLFGRVYDVSLGAVIGIVINLLIFPDKVDVEFRHATLPLLKSYSDYFIAIVDSLLRPDPLAVDNAKKKVEDCLLVLPSWVYEIGFDITLQKSYQYFLFKVDHVGEILFSMHYLARHSFDPLLIEKIQKPLEQCKAGVQQFFSALVTVLALKKLNEGIEDFAGDIAKLENNFRAAVPLSLELLDISKEYIYLAEFIYELKELRTILLKLVEALR